VEGSPSGYCPGLSVTQLICYNFRHLRTYLSRGKILAMMVNAVKMQSTRSNLGLRPSHHQDYHWSWYSAEYFSVR
jgi:hypothetical protein